MLPLLLLASDMTATTSKDVMLADRLIRVGDVAVDGVVEKEIIGQLPANSSWIELDEAAAQRLLRNRFPGLAFQLRFKGRVRLSAAGVEAARTGTCLAASVDVPAGEPITQSNTSDIACGKDPLSPMLGYDPETRSPFARSFIPAGTPLGALRLSAREIIPAGEKMNLRFVSGPVVVERDVVTLQSGEPGGRVFAATADGYVIAARLAPEGEECPQ